MYVYTYIFTCTNNFEHKYAFINVYVLSNDCFKHVSLSKEKRNTDVINSKKINQFSIIKNVLYIEFYNLCINVENTSI